MAHFAVPVHVPAHIGFLSNRGEDPDAFLRKCAEPDLFRECAAAGVLDMVGDWKLFVKSFKALKKNPWSKDYFGDNNDTAIKVRSALSALLPDARADPAASSKRMAFIAWVLFSTRSQIYLPQHFVKAFCAQHSVDLADMFDNLVRHPVYKNLYTTRDLRSCEISIERWLKNAALLGVDPQHIGCLDEAQNKTIANILTTPVSVMQGNAGCGKTTSICELMRLLVNNSNVTVIAAAFTHKAKKCIDMRIKNAGLDKEVFVGTVHSIIAMIKGMTGTGIFLVLDESSMLDLELLGDLSSAMTSKGIPYQLCLVGDYFQIQPVGKGEFFRQLVEDGTIVNTLSKCYRTDRDDLFRAYESLRAGKLPMSSENFKVELYETDKELSSALGRLINKNLDKYQIICWQNKHLWMINTWVQKALLKTNKIGPGHYKSFYTGDKVVYTGENDDTLTNAMTGIVVSADPSTGIMVEWEHTKKRSIYKDTRGIYLSYAISAHKSQGSEYKHVAVVCYEVEKMSKCLDRRWLYTSVTRGQHDVVLIATPNINEFVTKPLNNIPINNIRLQWA